jgi:outer membrane protein assembly factor BamA
MRIFYCFILLWFNYLECLALQDSTLVISDSLSKTPIVSSPIVLPQEGELNVIKFIGNNYFSSLVLSDAISLRPTNLSYVHQIFGFYYRQFSLNPYSPPPLRDALASSLRSYQDEYRFFDQTSAENDISTLVNLYNQNGFHNATVSYTFAFDSTERLNIVTFQINENKSYTLDTIRYLGLDSLPTNIQSSLSPMLFPLLRKKFNELSIKQNMDQILTFLQNNGYYFARYLQPIVVSDSTNATDSLSVSFSLGKRCKIGLISINHSYRDQPAVSTNLIREMITIHEGDWYSRSAMSHSQINLYSLGTFDLVALDTLSIISGDEFSTLPIQIFLQYRKLQEISAAPFINHTTYDNFTNFGFELSYIHHNLFGAAQSVNLFGRVVWQDFSFQLPCDPHFPYVFSSRSRELLAGIQFSQPFLFSIWSWKVGVGASSSYSNRSILSGLFFQNIPLKVSSLPIRISLPITLPTYTLFNSLIFDFTTEWQNIDNFDQVSTDMLNQIVDPAIISSFSTNNQLKDEFLAPYIAINRYCQRFKDSTDTTSSAGVFSNLGFICSFTAIGDSRDNPFSPITGNFLSTSVEAAFGGVYRFSRFQFTDYKFWNVTSNDVIAIKIRAGYIYIDLDGGGFIPYEKRFFAGGANSVRSYSARSLYDRKSSNLDSNISKAQKQSINNLTGNGALLEGSVEYRYRFSRPRGLSTMLADQIEQLGVTFFMDWGNVFNRIKEETYNTATLHDILTGLAIGIGAGIRRETPVGPIRVDFAVPLYDPTIATNQWIFSRPFFQGLIVNIGLGHAF